MFLKRGFTLIEVLIVIAMIAILSSAILVSISSQRDRARQSRVLVELSGVIQPMMMCWADGGTVKTPSGNGVICQINSIDESGYGTWPDISESGWNYTADYDVTSSGQWFIEAKSDNSNDYICCNSTYDKCADMGTVGSCAVGTVLP